MYAVYHGPKGLRAIAERIHRLISQLAGDLGAIGFEIAHQNFFDTIRIELGEKKSAEILSHAAKAGCNLRWLSPNAVGVSFDETTTNIDVELLMSIFRGNHV